MYVKFFTVKENEKMIDYIERDYSISSEKQKRKIKKEYEADGKTVLYISSISTGKNRGKIQVIYLDM